MFGVVRYRCWLSNLVSWYQYVGYFNTYYLLANSDNEVAVPGNYFITSILTSILICLQYHKVETRL